MNAKEKNVVCYNLFEAIMNLPLPRKKLDSFCQRWKVRELALFGSALRSDFRPDSDIDVLVSFDPAARWSVFDLLTMQEELKNLLGREVDLVEREALRNPFRRQSILNNREIIYAVSGS
jgi:predicted nucleotidyltransferase